MKTLATNVITSAITAVMVGLGTTHLQDGKYNFLSVNKLMVEEIIVKQGSDDAFMSISPRSLLINSKEGIIGLRCPKGEDPTIMVKKRNTMIVLTATPSEALLGLDNSNRSPKTEISLDANNTDTSISGSTGIMSCLMKSDEKHAGTFILGGDSVKWARAWVRGEGLGLLELP